MNSLACVLILLVGTVISNPVTQSVYASPQYVAAPQTQAYAAEPQIQYRQPYYVSGQSSQAAPVNEQADYAQPQYVVRQPLAQPILGNVDRQIQKAAHHIAGPEYVQQIQSLQLQNNAVQAQAQVQRNALRLATAPRAPSQSQPQYQRVLQPQPQQQQQQAADEAELQEDYNSNPSYQFGFDVKDDLYTNYQNRKEQREGNKITGSYSVVDSDGFLRTVTYTADPKEGFKAEVTRQPTDIVVKVPQPQPQHQNVESQQTVQRQPQYEQRQPQYERQPQYQRQPQYVEVPASQAQQQAAYEKQPRIVYQYQ